jgi:hypothetical protein
VACNPTQEAEIRRITVRNQSVRPYLKKNPSQKRVGGGPHGVGPEFKHQSHKKKNIYIYIGIYRYVSNMNQSWQNGSSDRALA